MLCCTFLKLTFQSSPWKNRLAEPKLKSLLSNLGLDSFVCTVIANKVLSNVSKWTIALPSRGRVAFLSTSRHAKGQLQVIPYGHLGSCQLITRSYFHIRYILSLRV